MAGGLLDRLGAKRHSAGKKFAVARSEEEWRNKLSAPQYRVLREHGTERAGSSPLDKEYGEGVYRCAGCGQPLFAAKTKFNSGTGWPSFWEPLDGGGRNRDRPQLFYDPDRGSLQPLRRSFGPCLR